MKHRSIGRIAGISLALAALASAGCSSGGDPSANPLASGLPGDRRMQGALGSCAETTGFAVGGQRFSNTAWVYDETELKPAGQGIGTGQATYNDVDDPAGDITVTVDTNSGGKLTYKSDADTALAITGPPPGLKDSIVVTQSLPNGIEIPHTVHCTGLTEFLIAVESSPPSKSTCQPGETSNPATGCFVCDGMAAELEINTVFLRQTDPNTPVAGRRNQRASVIAKVMRARLSRGSSSQMGAALGTIKNVFSAIDSIFTAIYKVMEQPPTSLPPAE